MSLRGVIAWEKVGRRGPDKPAPMDVRCERCNTEYEFDDALVSERGTTVKCTNCGTCFEVCPFAAVVKI